MIAHVYDGKRYDVRAVFEDAEGARWRFTGELETDGVPYLRRVGGDPAVRQERTLSDVVTNWGPLTAVPDPEGEA
jgi:hypothetical protein